MFRDLAHYNIHHVKRTEIPVLGHQCRSQKGRLRAQEYHCLGPATCSNQQCSKPSSQPISITITIRYSKVQYPPYTITICKVNKTAACHVYLFIISFVELNVFPVVFFNFLVFFLEILLQAVTVGFPKP